ncbi:hypothetical protein GCM10017562_04150 [Streptomyces roseofulvus]|uniref:hypothetical protein n=1 Tax=Streptomyces roseofulvus TaxID=33902 RepID=UPI0031F91833
MSNAASRRWFVTRTSLFLHILGVLCVSLAMAGCRLSTFGGDVTAHPKSPELVDFDRRVVDYARQAAERAPYTPPSAADRARLALGVGSLLDGDRSGAERLLAAVGFRVTRLTDAVSGRRYDEVAAREQGPEARWGRLYVSAGAAVRWSVQVPHPVSDRDTEALGAHLMEGTPHGALVLAGAHRTAGRGDAADVAHRTDSAFHAIVLELQKRDLPGIQLHGFAKNGSRPYDAILSTGAARTVSRDATALADLMEGRALRVCRGWSAPYPLEGATNAQGRSAQRRGTPFLHVELAPRTRADTFAADRAQAALATLLATWSDADRP